MGDAMVTGRMSEDKKLRGGNVLKRSGINVSQCINLLYDRMIEEGNIDFLTKETPVEDNSKWRNAAEFVDSLSEPQTTRFDTMTKAEIRMARLKDRGLM